MARILIHVEGQTEEAFVDSVLAPRLCGFGYSLVTARLLGESRVREKRGGIKPWPVVRQGIVERLRGDPGSIASTMVDFYGLPQEWPGRADATARFEFPNHIEQLMLADVCEEMGTGFNQSRFIPFVMLHEFEALLFSNCDLLAEAVGRPDLATSLWAIRDQFDSPEHIDDSPETAPSKRLKLLLPSYAKAVQGPKAIETIDLDSIIGQCRHFRGWLERLQSATAEVRG